MRLDNVATRHLGATNTAVVRALRGGKAHFRPSVGTAVLEQGVLLLDAEPGVEALVGGGGRDERSASVGGVRGEVGVQHFTEHQDVVATTQRVGAGEHRLEDAVRGKSRGLVGAGTVKTPDRQRSAVTNNAGLGTQLRGRQGSVRPDVFSLVSHHYLLLDVACQFAGWSIAVGASCVNRV